jgi:signal transduction histidine kinase
MGKVIDNARMEKQGLPAPPAVTASVAAAYLAGYLLLDWVSYIHPFGSSGITVWNPPPALSLALLLVGGLRNVWLLFPAAAAAEVLVRSDGPLALLLLVAAAVATGYGAAAWVMVRVLGIGARLRRSRDLLGFIGVVAAAAAATGAVVVGLHLMAGTVARSEFPQAWLHFWIGDLVGIVGVAPLLMVLADASARKALTDAARRPESWLQLATVLAALWLVFGVDYTDEFKYFYLLFMPVVWIAARHGLTGSACALFLVEAGLIAAVETGGHPPATVLELQALMLALAVTGLFLGIIEDERQRALLELRKSLRLAAAAEMAGALAHELNQPLTAIANYSRACKLALEQAPAQAAGIVDRLVGEAARAGHIVRRLRDFLRVGATQLAPVDVTELLREVLARARDHAALAGVDTALHLAPALPPLLADRLELELVLRNLIDNAIDAATAVRDGQRRVEVQAEAQPGWLRISVRDSGPGVAPDMAEKVFEPFITSKASGMGLGLAISRSIVEAHGGRLWAETGPGGGFHMTLPVVSEDD